MNMRVAAQGCELHNCKRCRDYWRLTKQLMHKQYISTSTHNIHSGACYLSTHINVCLYSQQLRIAVAWQWHVFCIMV